MSEEGRLRADEIQDVARAGRNLILERIEKMCMAAYEENNQQANIMHGALADYFKEGNMADVASASVVRTRYQGQSDAYFNLAEAVRTIRSGNEALKGGEVGELLRYGQEKPAGEPIAGSEDGADDRAGSVED